VLKRQYKRMQAVKHTLLNPMGFSEEFMGIKKKISCVDIPDGREL
jgi:hypothetical protein